MRRALTVGTDGACSGNPGPTGWSWVGQDGTWAAGSLLRSTNQVGELLGLLNAIRDHDDVVELTVELDSAYAMQTYAAWMDNHARRGWVTQAGKPTSNREVIEQLIAVRDARRAAGLPPVRLVKVKGHSGHPLNEAADDRAVRARNRAARGEVGEWCGEGLTIAAPRGA